jgi:protein phosphatase
LYFLYVEAYRRYCWTVRSLADLKLAPFHLLASEGAVHTAKDHLWHMATLARMCQADTGLRLATPFQVVDLTDRADQDKGIKWWEELTASGGEGMAVKPLEFRNTIDYTFSNVATETEAKEILVKASQFYGEVEDWITKNHPSLRK